MQQPGLTALSDPGRSLLSTTADGRHGVLGGTSDGTTLGVRRQAFYLLLEGGAGHCYRAGRAGIGAGIVAIKGIAISYCGFSKKTIFEISPQSHDLAFAVEQLLVGGP